MDKNSKSNIQFFNNAFGIQAKLDISTTGDSSYVGLIFNETWFANVIGPIVSLY